MRARSRTRAFAGIHMRRFSPTTISWSPSVQPGMTWLTENVAGWPRGIELSNVFPSFVQPV